MHKIYKFQIGTIAAPRMPIGAKILSVGMQDGLKYAWALVDVNAPVVHRDIRILGTGWEIEEHPGTFLGRITEGPFEWHVFDGGEMLQVGI